MKMMLLGRERTRDIIIEKVYWYGIGWRSEPISFIKTSNDKVFALDLPKSLARDRA
jgi:hypothetical protein